MPFARTLPAALVAALLALALLALPAAAGGWAVTTLDGLPADLQAGTTYQVGYSIHQHGMHPFNDATSSIVVSRDGERLVFPGLRDGGPGHYVAAVTLPTAGEWRLEVDQHPFAFQALGSVQVLAPAAAPVAAPKPAVQSVAAPEPPAVAAPAVEPAVVLAPAVEATAPSASEARQSSGAVEAQSPVAPAPLRVLLPLATLLAAGLFLARLLALVRSWRRPSAAPAATPAA